MTDTQSYIFDIKEVPSFFDDWNIRFRVIDMNGASSNFKLVFSSYAPSNIGDCLNGGILDTSQVTVITSVDCKLNWDKNSRIISVKDDTQWTIGDNDYPLKAVFLCNKSDNYVIGYCIHTNSFTVTNKVKIEDGTILWSITNE